MTASPDRAPRRAPLFDLPAIRFFLGYYRRRVARLVVFTLGTSLQSLLVLPALALIRFAFDRAIPERDITGLVRVGVAIIVIRAIGSVLSLRLRSHVLHTMKGAVTELRRDLVSRIYQLSHRHMAHADLAVLHARIVQDSERVDHFSNTLFSGVIPAAVASVVLLVVLVVLSWQLVLVGAVMFPLIWLAIRASGRFVRRDVHTFQRAFEGFSRGVQFTVRELDLTRVKAFEHHELERQGRHIGHLHVTGHRMAMSFAVHSQIQRTLIGIAGIAVLVVGGAAVARGTITLGAFITFYVAVGMFYGHLDTLTTSVPELLAGNASLVTLHRLMTDGEAEPYHGTRRVDFDGVAEMEAVTFGYHDVPVLRDVSLTIPSGARVAIVGPNGAGKSTLIHLLLGYYRPQRGRVLASGIPLDELDIRELRRAVGVVPQKPRFFAGSVRENITYGSPHATSEEIDAASRLALADEVIARLPDGYDTEIGDGGVRLSGGETQRLAIARALLGRPRMLILDEPTNHLDAAAVGRLTRNLASQPARPTLLIISHDPAVVEFADQVYRLEDGALKPATPEAANAAAV